MKYSIVLPHLRSSPCTELCLKYLKENSYYDHEIVEILDNTDVYYAFNKGVYTSKCETVVLLSDDMIVAKDWDKFIPLYSNQSTILTGYVFEPRPGKILNGPQCNELDCGQLENFNYKKFQDHIDTLTVPEVVYNAKGWYQPLVVNQRSFVTYPNIRKFPDAQNDCVLIDDVLPALGYNFNQIRMFAYHFQRQSLRSQRKRCIFTYSNFQVDEKIVTMQKKVIEKFNNIENCKFEYLFYNAKDGDVWPDQVIDYGFNKLFYEDNYDTILLLDIDCIPLSPESLNYTFDQAEKNILVGNAQRANHIENNKHVYIAPSALCISKELFETMGKPSFRPSNKGDVGEELTYVAEEKFKKIEMFLPSHYEGLPYQRDTPWPLNDILPNYGIGTTYVNKNGQEMFYHLFQSATNLWNDKFFLKCANILIKNV